MAPQNTVLLASAGYKGATGSPAFILPLPGDTGESITTWLDGAGYMLPPEYGAALKPYIDGGNFIFAAKVRSSALEGALAPIELHLPASDPGNFAIPFGLAAHSLPPGETLTITAYLLASGTVVPGNYGARAIDRTALVAESETETNYQELYDAAIAEDGGAWVVDASFDEFDTTYLMQGLDDAVAAGRGDGTDKAAVTAFINRVPLTGARLTRIRTTLGADQLHDMTLTKAALDRVEHDLFVTYDADAGGGCTLGSRRGVPLGALLMPLLLLLRRRRR